VDLELSFEQRSRLELIALHAGRPSAELLIEAAQYLFACEAGSGNADSPSSNVAARAKAQTFLTERQLEARFARILRRRAESRV
jgi:hypothetical protein